MGKPIDKKRRKKSSLEAPGGNDHTCSAQRGYSDVSHIKKEVIGATRTFGGYPEEGTPQTAVKSIHSSAILRSWTYLSPVLYISASLRYIGNAHLSFVFYDTNVCLPLSLIDFLCNILATLTTGRSSGRVFSTWIAPRRGPAWGTRTPGRDCRGSPFTSRAEQSRRGVCVCARECASMPSSCSEDAELWIFC